MNAINRAKTECDRGHPLSGDNLRISVAGYRSCRECAKITTKARKTERRIAELARLEAEGVRLDTLGRRVIAPPRTAEERFFEKIEEGPGGCWLRPYSFTGGGYVQFWFDGKGTPAHRWSYEFLRAEIPAGLQLDHLCRVRHCVNPWHLEPVTAAVNTRRSTVAEAARARGAAQTHCKRDHPLSGDNLYINPASNARVCRQCIRDVRGKVSE